MKKYFILTLVIALNVLKLTAQTACPNLVANSGFEAGNSAFTSALTSNPSCVLNTYVVSTNFNLKCQSFPSSGDHTTGTGKFLIVQGGTAVNVWATTVTVVPNTPYIFSFWLANAVTNTMTYAMIVNGTNVNQFTATQATPTWTKYTFNGVCPAGVTSLPIAIKQITFGEAFAFGIDDISFSSCGCQAAFNITSLSCGHYQVVNTSTGAQPITYKWCNGASTPNLDVQFDSCGKHDFCLTMTDATGCTSTATQSVTVVDNIPPVAVCKAGVGVILDPTTCVFAVTPAFVDAGSTDNCKIKSLSVNPTSISGCGNTNITLTVTDWCGNASTCIMGIQTIESVPPKIVCPPGFSANCNLNVGPNITGTATATDNCTAAINIKITSSDLVVGTIGCDDHIDRTWSAKDLCGNISTCKQIISVKDNLPPVISNCPPNMSVIGTIGANGVCTANVSFIKPTATDNCTASVTLTNNAPTVFPLGTTTVIWTATDNCGNKSTCNTVVDVKCQATDSCRCGGFSNMTFRPTQGGQTSNVKCGDTLTIPCTAQFNPIIGGVFNCLGNCTGTVSYLLIQQSTGSLVASGNLTVPSFSLSLLLSNLTQSGLYELTFSGQCGGQKCEQCKFFIKVLPAINATFTITSIGGCGHYQVVSTSTGAQPLIYKWCNGAVTSNTDFQFDTCGKQDICLTVTDAIGCTSSLTQSVTVIDTTPPKAICKPGVGVVLDANCAFAVSPAFVDAGSTDNCKIKSLSVSPTSISGCGNTNITLTVTDWCGNASTCIMGIQTIESVPPTIVCPPSFSANCNLNVGPNITGTATATDNCTAAINIKITSSDLVVGTIGCDDHIDRTWSAKDLCGNISTCKQIISVKDNLPPVISNCPPNMSVIGTIGANGVCTANVSFIKPTATDNCTASVTLTNNAPTVFPLGTTTVIWTATDNCGNKSTCNTVVDVKCQATDSCRCGGFSNMTFRPTQGGQTSNVKCGDTLTIPCTAQFNPIIGGVFNCLGNCTGTVSYLLIQQSTGSLVASGNLTVPSFSLSLLLSNLTQSGLYELTFSGQCGGQKCEQCKFFIKVLPAINATFTITSIGGCGHYQVVSTSTGAQPLIYKWCNGAVTSNTDFQFDTCGKQDICLTVTDAIGCTSSLTQSVTVIDTTPPKAICKPGVGVVLDANCAFAVSPAFVDAGSTDNCKIKSLSVSPTSISGCGNTNITLTVTDWCGNASTCIMGIQTIESVPPTIVCPPSFSANCNLNVGPNITGTATATDNCTAAINIKITSSDLVVGTIGCDDHIDRTWSAKDLCGNISTCKQIISVKDNLPPVISNCPQNMSVIGTIGANGVCTANVSFIKPTATDNCTPSVSVTNNAPTVFPLGTTTVIWTATDNCGNKSTCSTVIDVNCPSKDTCRCGAFAEMTFRPAQGAPTVFVKCGDTLTFACNTQFNPIIGGSFLCLGTNCTAISIYYELRPQGAGPIVSGNLSVPSFSLSLLSSYFVKAGFYELTFTGQCGTQVCAPCKFIIKVLPAININFGLTGYFPFAGNANDVSPSTTLVNGIPTSVTLTTSSNGIPNTAYNFNGTTSWIDCTNGTRGIVDKVSVCAWVKTTEQTNGMWVAGQYDGPAQAKGYLLSIGGLPSANIGLPIFSGRVDIPGGYHAAISTNKKVNDGKWHCIVGTAGSGEWKIYVDGVLSGSTPGLTTPSIVGNTKSFTIGRHSDVALNTYAFYNGDMDEVRVYNRVLTQCEVDSLCSVNIFTGKNDYTERIQALVYPNPNLGEFTLELMQPANSKMKFRITDLSGRILIEKQIESGSKLQNVKTDNLVNGFYFLQIISEGRIVGTEKIVKQE